MTDATTFRIEGTSIPDFAESALPKALAAVNGFSFTWKAQFLIAS